MGSLAESGLKLEKEYTCPVESSGLTKLVFDASSVFLSQGPTRFELTGLDVSLDRATLEFQTSETGYISMNLPVYVVKGYFPDARAEKVRGIIRPKVEIIRKMPRILNMVPPEFNFYIDGDEDEECRVGVSFRSYLDRLQCHVMPSGRVEFDDIGPKFEVEMRSARAEEVTFYR